MHALPASSIFINGIFPFPFGLTTHKFPIGRASAVAVWWGDPEIHLCKRTPWYICSFFLKASTVFMRLHSLLGYQACNATPRRTRGHYGWGSYFLLKPGVNCHHTGRTLRHPSFSCGHWQNPFHEANPHYELSTLKTPSLADTIQGKDDYRFCHISPCRTLMI